MFHTSAVDTHSPRRLWTNRSAPAPVSEHSHALRALRTFLQSDPRSRAHRALLARVFGRTHAQVPVDKAIDQLVASEESVIGFKECPVSQPYCLLHRSAQMAGGHVVMADAESVRS